MKASTVGIDLAKNVFRLLFATLVVAEETGQLNL